MKRDLSTDVAGLGADVLDHASEFVAVVQERAPRVYREMLASERFRMLLTRATFNHGKLSAYAEFLVFRTEFLERFPDATGPACINAFSKLFLKNDISISNLVRALESPAGQELRYLQGHRSLAEDSDGG